MNVRHFLALACLFAFVGGSSFGQDANKKADLQQKLIKLTDELTAAEVNADVASLDRIFTDDFTKTAASVARVQTKAEFLDGLKAGRQKYISFEFSDESARVYDASGIVNATIHFKVINGSNPVADNYEVLSAVWVQQEGKWRCSAWITYRVPQNPPAPAVK